MTAHLAPPGMRCACVARHHPDPGLHLNHHHVVPLSWGGQTTDENMVWLCPTAHELVHSLLNEYVRLGETPPWAVRWHYSHYIRELAERAIHMAGGIQRTYTVVNHG